ncbi:hypothetical protein ACWC4C_29135 [Streptomyces olivaceoviridis]
MDDLITVPLGEVVRFHDGEARAQWLLTAAGNLVKALRAAGPDVHMWSPSGAGTTAFQASWGVMETAVHRGGRAAVARLRAGCRAPVSGRAGDLLMLMKRRMPMTEAAVDVQGDTRLLEHWLENVLA